MDIIVSIIFFLVIVYPKFPFFLENIESYLVGQMTDLHWKKNVDEWLRWAEKDLWQLYLQVHSCHEEVQLLNPQLFNGLILISHIMMLDTSSTLWCGWMILLPFLSCWTGRTCIGKKNKIWMDGYDELKRIFANLIRRSIHVMKQSNFEPSIIQWFLILISHIMMLDTGSTLWCGWMVLLLSFPFLERGAILLFP